ncbi:hypothetical protein CJ197_06515 [Brachybacterium sp. UMB0905]|nr:hypothetical protein CJ197_06515 [Brachybacterium sp. UMB0905]
MTTRRGRALGAALTAGHRLRRVWWRVRWPRTFGVKVLLHHPELREARWLRTDLADVPDGAPLSRWLRIALSPPDPPRAPSSRPDPAPR